MQRGFSLIEVMIAVVILSVVLLSVLSLSNSSFQIAQNLDKKSSFFLPLASVALHAKKEHSNTSFSLSKLLTNRYKIEHDGIKDYLSNFEIHYEQDAKETIDLIPSGEESATNLRLQIIKHKIKQNNQNLAIYSVSNSSNKQIY